MAQTDKSPSIEEIGAVIAVVNVRQFEAERVALTAGKMELCANQRTRFAVMKLPLDPTGCAELEDLTRQQIDVAWKFAELSNGDFERLVPNRERRDVIELHMADAYGLMLGTRYTAGDVAHAAGAAAEHPRGQPRDGQDPRHGDRQLHGRERCAVRAP